MHFSQVTLFTILTAFAVAAPTAHPSGTGQPADIVRAAGQELPLNLDWEYCQNMCDCSKIDKETDYESFFQCFTNPMCEACAREGMSPPSQ
ncbi:hypothetical protein C8034_v005598 [Colletotrichum sidae]|uniref:Uncharacterized protein n=4 Tax=Colletotrichum orbiculare species complex TaxID=2707354 RepID=N4V989_COLOR|nr:hypothetical protein Cob_v010787 [Colletotrichum orbiculare MAFF 240422]TDZ33019.1 hypothetical protein C8035_v006017 [Colletotrichum spinosum]TDZ39946.1 hypothetical protein CTRI78_v010417 [Colletotrichum trifolii]TEA12836.1 hypothetical protein C8034_v005598 [Colletotrichum sidae]